MAKCAACKRKFTRRGKIITHETPDYIRVIHPRHYTHPIRNTDGFIFCSRRCMFRFFARDMLDAIISLVPKEV